MRAATAVASALVLLGATACQAPPSARNAAEVLAVFTNQVQSEGTRLRLARTEIAKERQKNIDYLEESAVRTRQNNELQQEIWKVTGDSSRRQLIGVVRALDEKLVAQQKELADLREKQAQRVAATETLFQVHSEKLKQLAKALLALAKDPSLKDELSFYKHFVTEVIDNSEELANAAESEAKAGTSEAKATGERLAEAETKGLIEEHAP